MVLLKKICFSILVLGSISVVAQNIKKTGHTVNEELYEKMLISDGKAMKEKTNVSSKANTAHITQIGKYNRSNLNVKASQSEVVFNQIGDHNLIDFNVKASSFDAYITQDGNNHKAFDFINSPADNVSLKLQQTGEATHFERYGSNSIGDKLQFEMNGNLRSIIVRNFK